MFRQSIRHHYENKVVCFRSCLNNLVTNGRSKKSKIILIYMAYYFCNCRIFLKRSLKFFFFSGFDRWGLGLLRNTDLITRFGRCQVSPLCSIVGTIEWGDAKQINASNENNSNCFIRNRFHTYWLVVFVFI